MRTLPITTKRVGDDEEAKTEDEIEIRFVHGERRVEKSPGLKPIQIIRCVFLRCTEVQLPLLK
jgi:hypothetical protein